MPKGLKGFQKGHKSFLTEESKIKISKNNAHYWLGKKFPKKSVEKMRKALKGHIPWNKGLKGYMAGNKHACKPDSKVYSTIHAWLIREYGKANKCENRICKGTCNVFDWALLKGKEYERKRENFIMLCRGCHLIYDNNWKKHADSVNISDKLLII